MGGRAGVRVSGRSNAGGGPSFITAAVKSEGRAVSTRGRTGVSERTSERAPLVGRAVCGEYSPAKRRISSSSGVLSSDSVSESEFSLLGVAAPLSLDTHSSSSSLPGLAMVKPDLDFDPLFF